MAVTVTPVLAGDNMYIADIEATADSDVSSGNIAHGLGDAPLDISLTALKPEHYLSTPYVSTKDATNVVITMANATDSGVSGAQTRVIIRRPHSMQQ